MEHLTESENKLVSWLEGIVKRELFFSLSPTYPERGQELWERFRLQLFTVRDAGITAKRFHGWHKAGLLPFGIPEGRMNLLTFPEFIWVRLINRLRELGTPLQHIKLLKGYLYEEVSLSGLFTSEGMMLPEVRMQVEQAMEQMQLPPDVEEQVLGKLLSGRPIDELKGHRMPTLEVLLFSQLTDSREAGVVMLPGHRFSLWMEGEARPNESHLYLSLTQELREFRVNRSIAGKAGELRLPTLPQ